MRNTLSVPACRLQLVGEASTSASACAIRSRVGVALAGAVVGAGALGLEVVDDHQEVLASAAARRRERLGERLAGVGERPGPWRMYEVPTGSAFARLVDERGADHVLVGDRGQVGRRGDGTNAQTSSRRPR